MRDHNDTGGSQRLKRRNPHNARYRVAKALPAARSDQDANGVDKDRTGHEIDTRVRECFLTKGEQD